LIFYPRIQSTEFHADESLWIAASHYFEAVAEGRLDSPVWGESYETLTQPPVGRYVIGIGRSIGGYGFRDLNRPWDFTLGSEENIARGHMPTSNLLWWSRFPMCILAVVSAVIAFILVSCFAGRPAGYVMLILFVFNPYFSSTLCRAMGEAPLLTATMLATLAAYKAVSSWKLVTGHNRLVNKRFLWPLLWFGLTGLFCGIAGATKLNGLSIIVAGLALSLLTPLAQTKSLFRSQILAIIPLTSALLILAATFTFVALNPYLYPDPIGRTKNMVEQRLSEMERQQASMPSARISGPLLPRVVLIGDRVFHQYAALSFAKSWIINVLLCSVGLGFMLFAAWSWLRTGKVSGASVVLLLTAFTSSMPTLMTPLDWDRYYLFPVFFSTVLIAIGATWIITSLFKRARGWYLPQDRSQGDPEAKAIPRVASKAAKKPTAQAAQINLSLGVAPLLLPASFLLFLSAQMSDMR